MPSNLEHDVALVCNSMEEHGVPFDMKGCGRVAGGPEGPSARTGEEA